MKRDPDLLFISNGGFYVAFLAGLGGPVSSFDPANEITLCSISGFVCIWCRSKWFQLFLQVSRSVAWSVVCRLSHSWLFWNRSTDLSLHVIASAIQWRIVNTMESLIPRRGQIWGSKLHIAAKPSVQYAATWRMQTSDSAFCQITSVLVIIIIIR